MVKYKSVSSRYSAVRSVLGAALGCVSSTAVFGEPVQ